MLRGRWSREHTARLYINEAIADVAALRMSEQASQTVTRFAKVAANFFNAAQPESVIPQYHGTHMNTGSG